LRPTILVVDDEPANREILVGLLSRHGYEVRAVGDGEAALAAIQEKPPDLVLLDVRLPGVDGFEVCRLIKQQQATRLTPVILVRPGISDLAHDCTTAELAAYAVRNRLAD
jgi:putative two-component system response regulator